MLYCRVTLVTFRVLEPYAVKVARTVLRRERRGNPPDLSGGHMDLALTLYLVDPYKVSILLITKDIS